MQREMKANNGWVKVITDRSITEYSRKLEPMWIVLEGDEERTPILVQPDGDDNYHSPDGKIYHYCDISHYKAVETPEPPIY